MVGQGRPIIRQQSQRWSQAAQAVRSGQLRLLCALLLWGGLMATPCQAESHDIRLRFAWGSNAQAKQQWTGQIEIDGGTFFDMQPLGIEPDESAALLLEKTRIVVVPPSKRGFDGCDISVRADPKATLRIRLAGDRTTQPTVLEVPLQQVADKHWQTPLDELGSFLIVQRCPGDRLRVDLSRKSLIFHPKERFQFQLQPDLQTELAEGPVQLELKLLPVGEKEGSKNVLWESTRKIEQGTARREPIEIELECPAQEGAYRLTIQAYSREGFASRLVPGKQAKMLASRDVELVVFDPLAKLPQLVDRWEPVLSFDPAHPKWWQRLPAWARVPQLSSTSLGALGNVRPLVRPTATGDILELPPANQQEDPPWQAYTLAVKEPGIPHLLEIEVPRTQAQHLGISIVEPDAAGRVTSFGRDTGLYVEALAGSDAQQTKRFRMVFWPRTRTPQVVLVNQHPTATAQFGRITLSSQHPATDNQTPKPNTGRLAAGYLATPRLVENMGAAEMLDSKSGLSVDSWSTFLESSRRLAQYLRYRGYNGVLLSVAADSSALYPSKLIGQSPRYDTGLLAAGGQDPMRKDVLELLLRTFDREGLRIVPTLQLATPLPCLERLRQNANSAQDGIAWVNSQGQTWLQQNTPQEGRAPYYNPLNRQVQSALGEVISELTERYADHKSFAGVALQLSGDGFAMLPGPQWGMDDSTVADFSQATSLQIAGVGPNRFRQRTQQLQATHADAWQTWRTKKLTRLYSNIAATLQTRRSDLQLILTTENLFAGQELQRQLRLALAGRAKLGPVLQKHGIDLAALDQVPGITALSPYRLAAGDHLQRQALDRRINTAAQQAELTAPNQRLPALFYHVDHPLRLASFDQKSSQGPSSTFYSTSFQSFSGGVAARRALVHALAQNDASLLVEGGGLLPLGQSQLARPLLQTWQQLPGPEAEIRTETHQPLVSRVYREADSTTVCLINEAPWPLQVELPLNLLKDCPWERLHSLSTDAPQEPSAKQQGILAGGAQSWRLVIPPYDLHAWKFQSSQLRVGSPTIRLSRQSRNDLQQRIEAIESRTSNLNIRRPYQKLVNTSFELRGAGTGALAWQSEFGSGGFVQTDNKHARSGEVSMHLQSKDQRGATVESQWFAMPETGQLAVSFYLRGEGLSPKTRLRITLQSDVDGSVYRRTTTAGVDRPIRDNWARYELAVDDLPLGSDQKMHVKFHLSGTGDVWLDDVQLFDLQFDTAQRVEFVKKVYAARTALDQGQVVDCLRLVEDYWSQYLVQYVPPLDSELAHTAQVPSEPTDRQPPEEPLADDQEDRGFGHRLRGFVPRLWR